MALPSFLSPNVPSAKLVLTSAHIACLSERSVALAKRLFRRFANSHARVATATISRGVFNHSCGCFRKKSFYLSLFQSNIRRHFCRRVIISRCLSRRIIIFHRFSPSKIFSRLPHSDNPTAPTVSNRSLWFCRRFCLRTFRPQNWF